MPNYDYECPSGHLHEIRCSIADKPLATPCPECGESAHFVITSMPPVNKTIVFSYPGSKKHKAGYQHSHGDKPATKVSSGYGGALNPSTAPEHPLTKNFLPEWKSRPPVPRG